MDLANIIQLWTQAWPAGLTMLSLGSGFALVLLVASEKLKVEVDPKIEQINEALPNIDCGACGYAGCSSYAKAVAADPELIGKCAPGGAETSDKIAEILNLQISAGGHPQRPIVHCRAHTSDKTYHATYGGIKTCTTANALANVQACKYGCLGYSDCVSACKFNALHIIDGLAAVNYENCTGCTACAKACPRNLISMVPFSQENMLTVACSSEEAGKNTRKMCKVGCIACKLCTKQSQLFTMGANVAQLDYENFVPSQETAAAVEKCPTKVIVERGKSAKPDINPAAQAKKASA